MFNDCAFVGETLTKYFPEEIQMVLVKRTRGLWSKTFGVAWKIIMSKADVYHVHYLLQDCYLASKLKKRPLIGHAHGSDLRQTLKRRILGKIVESNLRTCDKVIVSTPDILKVASEYQEDAEYVPNPVDTKLFHPLPHTIKSERLRILIASKCDWKAKRTNLVVEALSTVRREKVVYAIQYGRDFHKTVALAESLGLKLQVLPSVSHNHMSRYYQQSDLVIGTIGAGVLGMVSLEAVACGRPVVSYVSSSHNEYERWPLKDVQTPEQIAEAVETLSPNLWKREHEYLKESHDPLKISKRVIAIYKTCEALR